MSREWSEVPGVRIVQGDCLDVMPTLEAGSVDAVVTDPPYALSFMSKNWDKAIPGPEYWKAALRVAKPGAFLVAFGGTRTFHRLTCAIEDAGWEIRDCLSWLFGTGFPKSKSCLKPGWEPIVLAKAPGELRALGIDECRLPTNGESLDGGRVSTKTDGWDRPWKHDSAAVEACRERGRAAVAKAESLGRWPANLILSHHPDCDGVCDPECPVRLLGEQSGERRSGEPGVRRKPSSYFHGIARTGEKETGHSDTGTAARFYYTSKASRRERRGSSHPTVKPVAVMTWLVKLVCPPGGTVLDPFAGTGTTAEACVEAGMKCVAIEREAEYFDDACRRVADAAAKTPLFV